MRWESFCRAVDKADKAKAVGPDGFNAYLLRMAPLNMQKMYWRAICEMVRTSTYPPEYKEWTAMLAMKPGEDARDLTRRRDLWITCHGQKIIMRMLNTEYERAADASVSWLGGRLHAWTERAGGYTCTSAGPRAVDARGHTALCGFSRFWDFFYVLR